MLKTREQRRDGEDPTHQGRDGTIEPLCEPGKRLAHAVVLQQFALVQKSHSALQLPVHEVRPPEGLPQEFRPHLRRAEQPIPMQS